MEVEEDEEDDREWLEGAFESWWGCIGRERGLDVEERELADEELRRIPPARYGIGKD